MQGWVIHPSCAILGDLLELRGYLLILEELLELR